MVVPPGVKNQHRLSGGPGAAALQMLDHFLQDLGTVVMTPALTQLSVQGDEDGKGMAAITGFARIAIDFAAVSGNDFPQFRYGEAALCSGCGEAFGNGEVFCRHVSAPNSPIENDKIHLLLLMVTLPSGNVCASPLSRSTGAYATLMLMKA